MANYTIELGQLVNRGYPLALNDYPIFDESHRDVLNKKIISHYFFREIGAETPDRFNWYLRTKMHEIMPYYNELYKSELIDFDPLETFKYNENVSGTKNQKEQGNSQNNLRETGNTTDTYGETKKSDTDKTLTGKSSETVSENSESTNADTVTNNLTELQINKGDTESTQTNNLTTTNATQNTGGGTNVTSGTKQTDFSDVPQTGINTTTVETVNPDGSITRTTTSTGYLTTRTTDTTNENAKTTTNETSNGVTTNTGTTGTTNIITENRSNTKTGTVETETTNNASNSYDKSTETEQTDSETVTASIGSDRSIVVDNSKQNSINQNVNIDETQTNAIERSGRQGTSPAALISEYRAIILNIDMMIIDELETLFMGVF